MTNQNGNSQVSQTTTVVVNSPAPTEERHFLFSCMKLSTLDKISVFLSEFLGTAILVFMGCMSCVSSIGHKPSHLEICLTFGFAIMLIVNIFACVSGSHLNPAVTLAAFIYKHIPASMIPVYVVAQMLGGFLGYGVLILVTPTPMKTDDPKDMGVCVTVPTAMVSDLQAVFVEFLITGILILVCCGVWDPRNAHNSDSIPVRFGLTIVGLALVGGPYTGASMNPARSFGPALWNMNFRSHWVYWVGPLAAGGIVPLMFRAIFRREVPEKKTIVEELPLASNKPTSA